jgi:2-(1,2-epoxy-1,2-dihydrophenyl)acetyl-CoA isomerase
MQFQNILFEKAAQTATITLNRPAAYNALNEELFKDLARALELCADDEDTRAVVLTGAGKAFCSGGDIAAFREEIDTNPSDPLRQLIKILNICILGLRALPKPVIAAVNGAVGGGGMSLMAACDLRICSASVRFRQAYTNLGLTPDGGWALTVGRLIGFNKAQELIFLDPVFNAEQALAWGLVNQVVADGDLSRIVMETAMKLAKGPTQSFAIAKENMNYAMLDQLERQLERERSGMVRAAKTADYKEGMRAFFEKRPPVFSGR